MLRTSALTTGLALLAASLVFLPVGAAQAGERFKPLGPDWLESGLYAGKLTMEVEDCICPELLVIGFQFARYVKFGFSRTKMPFVPGLPGQRDEQERVRRYGGMLMVVVPF